MRSTSPFSGYTVDLLSRRLLIALGLAFWSLICAATALSRNFVQLVLFRAAEGLGESFYFPASMSVLADYHGPRTRSRAMSIHQTSVYLGTAGGAVLAGYLGERYGWRSPFWVLGLAGLAYAVFLGICPGRTGSRPGRRASRTVRSTVVDRRADAGESRTADSDSLAKKVARIVTNPAAALLLAVFVGANFVAATFLAWLPLYIFEKFELEPGQFVADLDGLAARQPAWAPWRRRGRPTGPRDGSAGGRIRVQSLGLILARAVRLPDRLVDVGSRCSIAALIGAGLCKGIYDANIFASLYDVIRPRGPRHGGGADEHRRLDRRASLAPIGRRHRVRSASAWAWRSLRRPPSTCWSGCWPGSPLAWPWSRRRSRRPDPS